MKFETGQTSEPTSANISIVSRSSNCGPTKQCCVRLHSTSNNVAPAHTHYMPRIHTKTCEQEINMASEMENVPESFVF